MPTIVRTVALFPSYRLHITGETTGKDLFFCSKALLDRFVRGNNIIPQEPHRYLASGQLDARDLDSVYVERLLGIVLDSGPK